MKLMMALLLLLLLGLSVSFAAAPPLYTKAPGWKSLTKDYNAVGNGIADDTVAWNSALAQTAANGYTLWVPEGTYKVTNTLNFGTGAAQIHGSIVGAGGLLSVINYSGPTTGTCMRVQRLIGGSISGLQFNNTGAKGTTKGLWIHDSTGGGTRANNNVIENCYFLGWNQGLRFGDTATAGDAASEFRIESILAQDCNDGVYLEDANTLDFIFTMFQAAVCSNALRTFASTAVHVYGGSTSANTNDFFLQGGGAVTVTGFRSETARRFMRSIAPGPSAITVSGCVIENNTSSDGWLADFRDPNQVVFIGNRLGGPVAITCGGGPTNCGIVMIGNEVTGGVLFTNDSTYNTKINTHYSAMGNQQVDIAGLVIAQFPDEIGYGTASAYVPFWKTYPAQAKMDISAFTLYGTVLPSAANSWQMGNHGSAQEFYSMSARRFFVGDSGQSVGMTFGAANELRVGVPDVAPISGTITASNTFLGGLLSVTNGLRIGLVNQATITNILSGSATLNFASQDLGGSEDLPITVTGAADGDAVSLGYQSTVATGIIGSYSAWASNGVVFVRFIATAATQNPNSGVFKVVVTKVQ